MPCNVWAASFAWAVFFAAASCAVDDCEVPLSELPPPLPLLDDSELPEPEASCVPAEPELSEPALCAPELLECCVELDELVAGLLLELLAAF